MALNSWQFDQSLRIRAKTCSDTLISLYLNLHSIISDLDEQLDNTNSTYYKPGPWKHTHTDTQGYEYNAITTNTALYNHTLFVQ